MSAHWHAMKPLFLFALFDVGRSFTASSMDVDYEKVTSNYSAALHLMRVQQLRKATQAKVVSQLLRAQYDKTFKGIDEVCAGLKEKHEDVVAELKGGINDFLVEHITSISDEIERTWFSKLAKAISNSKKFWRSLEIFYWLTTISLTIGTTTMTYNQAAADQDDSSSGYTPLSKQCYDKLIGAVTWYQTTDLSTYDDLCEDRDPADCESSELSPLRKLTKCVRKDMDRLVGDRRDNHINVAIMDNLNGLFDQMWTHWSLDDASKRISKELDMEDIDDKRIEVAIAVKACNLDKRIHSMKKAADFMFAGLKERFHGIPSTASRPNNDDLQPFFDYENQKFWDWKEI
jgi:hypothetical protein